MQPIEFPEQTNKIAEHQQEYLTCPAYISDSVSKDTVMKISVSPEELKQIAEQGFFWYKTMTLGQPLQPFSFQTETPFAQMVKMNDLSPNAIKQIIQVGSRIGNFHVGRDLHLFEVISVNEKEISYKIFDSTGAIQGTTMADFYAFSNYLNESNYPDSFFIVNPK